MRRKGLMLALVLTAAAFMPETSRATSCTDECYSFYYQWCAVSCQATPAECWQGLQDCLTSCAQHGWANQIC